jgi:outer membrane protein assembly factor BamB/tetratricopeptide (TPR) repeat protein
MAYELSRDGAQKWELGKRGKGELDDAFFLGAPLPLGDLLYVLVEKNQELKLVTLKAATGELVAQQKLANNKDLALHQDSFRRTQAALPAYGEGLLVVPTNAGAVFGIDLVSNSLAWAYPYRQKEDAPVGVAMGPGGPWGPVPAGWRRLPDGRLVRMVSSGIETHWKFSAPIIADGKVIFTAPDSKHVHCVNLRDGTRVWAEPRSESDQYLGGVYNGKVLIVGKGSCRAISLARGDTLWKLDTGVPSGYGVAAPLKGGAPGRLLYYLPLKSAVRQRGEPAIAAIDIERGLAHYVRSRKKDVPGNLLFFAGNLLSQTTTELRAYPQLELFLARLDTQVADKPNDPEVLTQRGDYRLDKGDLGGAIADFRKALANKPDDDTRHKARANLYDALTEYFQRDFDKAERYIEEYEELCKVDLAGAVGAERAARIAEERRRRADFLCLVGKGREAQNRLVDAFEKYLELGQTARRDELIQVVDEPSVKAAPDVWSQGRIAAMVANAKDDEQRKALEERIIARWKKLQGSKTPALDDLRKFVKMFGSLFDVGKQARLALAERLMEDTDLNSLLEAEQQLSLLRNPGEKEEITARAIEALARLNERKGHLEDAAYYYRILGHKYGKMTVSDGRTGAAVLEDLDSDKRFLPYLDQPGRRVLKGKTKVEAREEKGSFPERDGTIYHFGHVGEAIPFFQRNWLGLRFNDQHLRLADTGTNEERWTLKLTPTQFQQIATANNQPHLVKFNYQTVGHLVVLQLGHMVFGIDPLNKGRVLWEKNLAPLPMATTGPSLTSATVDPRDHTVQVLYNDGWMQRLGQAGPLQGSVICLLTKDALTAVDPVTGRVLWTRSDVTSSADVFGDENNIYVVDVDPRGNATASRAFRAYDGVSVRVRNFADEYQNRLRLLGRNILVSDTDAKNVLTLRIYDVLAGKDLWSQKFAAGATVLRSEAPRLAGAVEANGTVRVVDLGTGKVVLNTKLRDPSHLAKAKGVYLVADPDFIFLAIDGPTSPDVQGAVMSNLTPGSGLRSVPVSGHLYCFKRDTGAFKWYVPVLNQMLVLAHFEESPVVLLTGRYNKRVAFNFTTHAAAAAFEKRTGKMKYLNESLPQFMYFHAVQLDPRTGKIELVGSQEKVTFSVVRADK